MQGLGVFLELQQFPVRVILGQPDIRRGAGGDDGGAGRQVIEVFHFAGLWHQCLYCDFQVWIGEVHRFLALRGHGHVGQDQVDLVTLQERNPARRFHRDEFDLVFIAEQILGKLPTDVSIEPNVTPRFIDETKRRLVGENADDQLVPRLDFVQVAGRRSAFAGDFRLRGFFGFVAAGQQREAEQRE
ncbi:hypothetical protein D3C84_786110 [compost metagenome]